ncbi:MAG: hypothetical protein WCM76_14835 [Bacteroidota bacterium]
MKFALATSLSKLEEIIAMLTDDLRRYAQKEKANQQYVQKQNKLIQDLCGIHNDMDCLNNVELLSDIEQRMKELEAADPQIDSHCILIHRKPGPVCNNTFIEIKPGLT